MSETQADSKRKLKVGMIIIVSAVIILLSVFFVCRSVKPSDSDEKQTQSDAFTVEAITKEESRPLLRSLTMRDTLNDEDKKLYDKLYNAIVSFEPLELRYEDGTGFNDGDVLKVRKIVEDYIDPDHPEIFWLNSAGSFDPVTYTYTVDTNYTKKDAEKLSDLMDAYVDSLIDGKTFSNDYEKALWAYEWVIENTVYDKELAADMTAGKNISMFAYGATGVFFKKTSACAGYSKAFQILMNKLGVPCGYVTGYFPDGGGHAWNIIKLGDGYYHVDTTWGDNASDHGEYISYDYFCLTDSEILRTRTIDNSRIYPVCDKQEYNYYMLNGLYMTSVDIDRIAEIIKKSIITENYNIQIKFSSEKLLEEAKELDFSAISDIPLKYNCVTDENTGLLTLLIT